MVEQKSSPLIRALTDQDAPGFAHAYMECFPDDFFTGLGGGFLKHYCRQLANDPLSVTSVLEDPQTGQIIGLAVGSMNLGLYSRVITRGPVTTFISVMVGIFKSSAVRKGVIRAIRSIKRVIRTENVVGTDHEEIPPITGKTARFIVVGVCQNWRGGGNAERLVRHFTDQIFALGADRVTGIVHVTNPASLILWKRLGWHLCRTTPSQYLIYVDKTESPAGPCGAGKS